MRLDPKVTQKFPGFCVGYGHVSGVTVEKEVQPLLEKRQEICTEIKRKYGEVEVSQIPEIRLHRDFFKAMGVDPSSSRPAPEYLLRRALEDRFPSINNVVDCCLLVSLQHMVSTGAYDLKNVTGQVITTLAEQEQELSLIDGRKATVKEGEVVLRDERKILAGIATGDSKSAAVTYKTSDVLVVVWNAPGIGREKVEKALADATAFLRKYCGGHVEKTCVL